MWGIETKKETWNYDIIVLAGDALNSMSGLFYCNDRHGQIVYLLLQKNKVRGFPLSFPYKFSNTLDFKKNVHFMDLV